MAIIIEHMEMPNGCCECRMQTENCCTLSLRRIDDIYDRPEWCLLTEAEPICSICKSSVTGFDFKPLKHTEERKNCPMRHENGNCLAIGGFCLAVNNEICHGLHNAYNEGVKAEMHRDTESWKTTVTDLTPVEYAPVKHGRWIKRGDSSWECSVCHEISCCNGNYCVDCGARMDLDEVCHERI